MSVRCIISVRKSVCVPLLYLLRRGDSLLVSTGVGSEEPLSVGTGEIWIPRFFCVGLKLEYRQTPKTLGQWAYTSDNESRKNLNGKGAQKFGLPKRLTAPLPLVTIYSNAPQLTQDYSKPSPKNSTTTSSKTFLQTQTSNNILHFHQKFL